MTNLALERDELLHKLIANKAARGYQIEITTNSGNSYFGFVTGLDEDQIQIITTPFGRKRGNIKHIPNSLSLADDDGNGDTDFYQWIFINSIESISENRLSLRHFNKVSRDKLEKSQKSFVFRCELFLKGPA